MQTASLQFRRGDATRPAGDADAASSPPPPPRIIAHVCNDIGRWGRGFVLALTRRFGSGPADAYREWHAAAAEEDAEADTGASETGRFGLGRVQLVRVGERTYVANMVAQHGIRSVRASDRSPPPIRYDALGVCLRRLATLAAGLTDDEQPPASIHMPRIGCGLAGGTWSRVEPLVREGLVDRGCTVTVYDL